MRDVPELTFRGALSVLGHYDRPVLERLNSVLGGAIMVGGVIGLAAPAVAPAVGLAALWGWVDQKNEADGRPWLRPHPSCRGRAHGPCREFSSGRLSPCGR